MAQPIYQLMMMALMGCGGGFVLKLSNDTVDDVVNTPSNATAGVHTDSDGDFRGTGNTNSFTPAAEWISPKSGFDPADFEVRLTVSSGDAPTGGSSVGSWLVLSTNRSWTLTTVGPSTLSGNWLVEIGDVGTSTAIVSATITVGAQENV